MAIARGVTSRLVEGIIRDLAADSDLAALVSNDTSTARIYKGPLMGAEGNLMPRQINVVPVTMPYEPGVANASTVERTIAIVYFDFYDLKIPSSGTGALWAPDVLEHIAKILMTGGGDNDLGRIVDPDAAPGAVGAAKYLNNAITVMSQEPWYAAEGNVAIAHRLVVTFETRINQSMTRV